MNVTSLNYYRLALFTTLLALVVVMLGAYTRLSDAGLGCPDWPGCYGHLTVPQTANELQKVQQTFPGETVVPAKAWKEMIHRYFAGTLGVLIVILALWGTVRRFNNPKQPIVVPLLLIGLVVFQAVLGMWTVTWKVLPLIVSAHLLGGIFIAGLLWYVALATRPNQLSALPSPNFKPWVLVGLGLVILQLFLGAWTSTNYAALACTDFPNCHANLTPKMDFFAAFNFLQPIGINYEGGVLDSAARITIQMMHRYGAAIVGIYVGLLAFSLLFTRSDKKLRCAGLSLLAILAVQILLGIGNVIWSLPLAVAVMHNGMAALLLLAMVTVLYRVTYKQNR